MSRSQHPGTDPPVPRGWSRQAHVAIAGVVVVAVVAVTAAAVVITAEEDAPAVLPDAAAVFGDDGVLFASPRWARFSPTGRLVLVRTSAGIGLATGDDETPDSEVALLTPPGSRAVDAAWFPGETAVLVAEGPIPTGQLAVVELDGTVRGAVPLTPSFGVGTGHGMTVSPDGRHAVVTAEEREAVGGMLHLHLVFVDLEEGLVTELTRPDGPDESGPTFVSSEQVAYTETTAGADGGSRAMVLDLADGTVEPVSPLGDRARAVGVVNGVPVYVSGDDVWIAARGARRRLAAGLDGDVLAVHPTGSLVIVLLSGQAQLIRTGT